MATINVSANSNLTAVTYVQDDIINVLDGVTLTVNSQWSIRPRTIQALGTGRIEVSNSSNTVPHLQEFFMGAATNSGGFIVNQNAVLQIRGGWITVGTSTGANNQVLFSANNIGGVAIDYPTMIQVETGSGTNVWEIWNAIPEDVTGGTVNTLGFNGVNTTTGTVAVTAGGVVTGTGTNFLSTQIGLPFKLPSIARDFVISAVASTTSMTIQELDGATYTGGVVTAGASYIIRNGSLIAPAQVGSGDVGKVLFFNPLTTAVRMGDGTNGTKIPTGARVRVPNIHFNSAIQQTTLATAITGTGAQAFTLAAAIGSASVGTYSAATPSGTLLLVSGSTVERIFYSTRAGAVVSATGMVRGAFGTTAQASFPIGTLVYWIPANTSTVNNASFNPSPSGTVDLQILSVGLRMATQFSNFGNMVVRNFGYAVLFNAGNCSGTFEIDSLSCLGVGYQFPTTNGGIGAQFSALLGIGSINNIHVSNNLPNATNAYTNIALGNVQGLTSCSNLRSRHWGRSTSAGGGSVIGVGLQTVSCTTPITGIYAAGSSVRWNALTNLDTANIFISCLPNANTCSSADAFIPIFVQGITDSTIRGIQLWGGGLSTRSSLISIDQPSSDVVFHNKGYPVFNGGSQLSSIITDVGLDTIVAHISISNPRITTTSSVLFGNVAFNRGGFQRMVLIDSITSTAAGSGAQSKGGLEMDVVAGPHRSFQTVPANAIIANLTDVQPIIVMSNLAKTVGSVYVGAFTAEGAFDMYDFTGSVTLDNLGRIYYPNNGDSIVIKSVFPLRGITNFTGTAFDFNYNLVPGNNPVPAGTTLEFRMTNWGTTNNGAWTAFVDNSTLETARAALSGYSSSVGIDLQFRVTGTTAVTGRYIMSIKLPVTIDATYNPPVYTTEIGFNGAQTGTLIAGYLNADPNNPALQSSLTLASSAGSVPMPYDYDAVPVAYRLIARYPGWTFSSLTGTYLKTPISIPITQNQILDVNSDPLYSSGVTGVAVDHNAQTITLSASRSAAQVWSAVQDNVSLLANLTKADPFTTTNGSTFTGAYTLVVSGGGTLTSGNILGNVTLAGALSSGVAITGNVSQATPTNLSGVTITGNLTYNTNTPITVTLTNTTITGTVSNSGSGLITISRANSTIGTVGSNVVTRPVTSLTLNGLTAGSQVYIANGSGTQVAYVASSSTSYTLDTTGQTGTWTWKVVRYGFTAQTDTHSPAVASTTVTVTLAADAFITQATKATVAAYEYLPDMDKLYDYAAYYETLEIGIPYSRIITKAGTNASAGSYPVTLNDTGDLFIFDGSSLSIWTGNSLSPGTTITGALFSSSSVTILPSNFSNTAITANVIQPIPFDLTGMTITGNLTYDDSAPYAYTVTITDSTITGTISNAGVAEVKVIKAGTSPFFTAGSRVSVVAVVAITTPNNLALSTYVTRVNGGAVDFGWVVQDTARTLEIRSGDTFAVYAVAYGYQRALFYPTASNLNSFTTTLIPETFVDTTLNTTNRNYIATQISTALVGMELAVSVGSDLRAYSPAEVLNGLHYYTVVDGALPAQVSIFAGSVAGFTIIPGGIEITSPVFYAKVNDSVTTTTNLGVLIPLYFQVAASVYVINPSYTPTKKNSSGIVLQTAPWTQQTAVISATDKADISSYSANAVWNTPTSNVTSSNTMGSAIKSTQTSTNTLLVTTNNIQASTNTLLATTNNIQASANTILLTTNNIQASTNTLLLTTNNIQASTNTILLTTNDIQASTNTILASTNTLLVTTNNIQASTNTLLITTNNIQASTNTLLVTTNNIQASTNTLLVTTNNIQTSTDLLPGIQASTNTLLTTTNNIQTSTNTLLVTTNNIQASTDLLPGIQASTNTILLTTNNIQASTNTLLVTTNNIQTTTNTILMSTDTLLITTNNIQASTNTILLTTNNIQASTNTILASTNTLLVTTNNIQTSTDLLPGIQVSTNTLLITTNNIQASTNTLLVTTNNIQTNTNTLLSTTNTILASTNTILFTTNDIQASTNTLLASTNTLLVTTNNIQASTNTILTSTNTILLTTNNIQASTNTLLVTTNNIQASTNTILLTTNTILDSTNTLLLTTNNIQASTNTLLITTNNIQTSTNTLLSTTNTILTSTNTLLATTNNIQASTNNIQTNTDLLPSLINTSKYISAMVS